MASETEIIQRIWKRLPSRVKSGDWLRLGVGDDAAVLHGGISVSRRNREKRGDWILSCDQFLEGVHFLPKVHPPNSVGYKALARATSDLAAMGAEPRFFMLSLALPSERTGRWLDEFMKGIASAARQFKMVVIGGDISRFPSVAVNLTVGGLSRSGQILTRAGAKPGDLIYVSGTLGAAQLGLELILKGRVRDSRKGLATRDRCLSPFLAAHLAPRIHLALGQWLAGSNPKHKQIASAAIDVSDGLSTDLVHICESSGVGARIWAGQMPVVRIPRVVRIEGFEIDPIQLALNGGEDYQLLFTVPPSTAREMPDSYQGSLIAQIGEIVPPGRGKRRNPIEVVDTTGRSTFIGPSGWDPFRKTR